MEMCDHQRSFLKLLTRNDEPLLIRRDFLLVFDLKWQRRGEKNDEMRSW